MPTVKIIVDERPFFTLLHTDNSTEIVASRPTAAAALVAAVTRALGAYPDAEDALLGALAARAASDDDEPEPEEDENPTEAQSSS